MNMEKFTDRSKGFLQNAQSLASRHNNQFVVPAHLLKVMLDDNEGLATNLIAQSGADVDKIKDDINNDINKLPAVEGPGAFRCIFH